MTRSTHREMAQPRALKPGDTIGVVAPSSPFDRNAFDRGVRAMESMGFRLAVPEEVFQASDFLAGTDQCRANAVNRLFADPDIDGIICARGGYGSMRILPLLNRRSISRNPKVFVGFSDITALLGYFVSSCAMVAFHGPTITTLGTGDSLTRERFLTALTRPKPLTLTASKAQVVCPGRARGTFFCGNLTVLCHLTGTAFQPDYDGCILLVEDRGEAPYRIDRMLTQMIMAGCFNKISGVALGNFSDCGSLDAVHRIFAERLGELHIPILSGFDVGHEAINTTVPVGLAVELDTFAGTLAFTGSALREE